jgi:hypothetical protein
METTSRQENMKKGNLFSLNYADCVPGKKLLACLFDLPQCTEIEAPVSGVHLEQRSSL